MRMKRLLVVAPLALAACAGGGDTGEAVARPLRFASAQPADPILRDAERLSRTKARHRDEQNESGVPRLYRLSDELHLLNGQRDNFGIGLLGRA